MADNKNSFYDPGLIVKEVHDFYGQFIRTSDVRSVVPNFYTHFRASYNIDSLPTEVSYYRGTTSHVTELGCLADVAGSLNNKYLFIYSAPDDKKFHIWFNVNGAGVDPAPLNSTGIEIALSTNDPSVVVATAITLTVNGFFNKEFVAARNGSVVEIRTVGMGLITNSADFNSAFVISNTPGTQELVSYIEIAYDGSDPIYEGQVLKNYRFDIFSGTFDNKEQVTVDATDLDIRDLVFATDKVDVTGSEVTISESNKTISSVYGEVSGIAMAVTTLVATYTAGASEYLQKAVFSGTNIAEYELVVDGSTVDKKRTYFGGSLNDEFSFNENGLPLTAGQVVEVYAVHYRNMTGDFNARIQIMEVA